MALRSIQFVRSVNQLMVRKEVFTVRKLHIIIDTAVLLCSKGGVVSLRSVQFIRSVNQLT